MTDITEISEAQMSLMAAIIDKQNKNIYDIGNNLQNQLVVGAYAGDIFNDIIATQIELSRVMDINSDYMEALNLPKYRVFKKQ